MVIEQVKRGKSRNPGQGGGRTGKSRIGAQMSKPVKKKTMTKKSLGGGSRWQKGTPAWIQNRDNQTSDFLVPEQGSSWFGAAGRTPGCLSGGRDATGALKEDFFCFNAAEAAGGA